MVKQYISAVLEDLVGEYILNISKEKLKVSTIKGKIKLDNVELDGDFIGSHILSAVGLSGFGVLSCWARRLQINIPWKNLDNEPTSLEIRGMHLICVPLLPTTANRVYYGGGVDSSLSLRTRAKRAALARFERNFFSGRIPGEDQQMQQQQQERNGEDGDVLSYSGRRRQYSSSEDVVGVDEEEKDLIGDSVRSNGTSKKTKKEARIPALKRKLKAKIYGNLVSSLSDVHIRFEVPEGGLERSKDNTVSSTRPEISDERAFAFGLTLKSLTARNVSGDESSGSIDTQASNNSDTKRKKIDIQDLSVYWDDGPPFLISESDLFNGRLTLPASVSQQRIAEIMQQMSSRIDPDVEAKRSLSCKDAKFHSASVDEHDYICTNFSQAMHTTFCKGDDEDSLHFVEMLPSNIEVNLTPQQYRQYQRLKDAVLAQQRFDTMLHQRPTKPPTRIPRLWWQYAIACVRHNPTSRSWTDVKQIVQCRKAYIELVMKNLLCESEKSGFHGGLTKEESRRLLELESLLPIETLISFHLLALRRVVARRFESQTFPKSSQSIRSSFTRRRSSSSVGRRLFYSLTGSSNSFHGAEDGVFGSSLLIRDSSVIHEQRIRVPSLLEDDDVSLSPAPTTHTTCKLHLCSLKLSLLDRSNKKKAVTIKLDFKGTSYDSGSGKSEIAFDIARFDVFDFVTSTETRSKVLTVEVEESAFPDIGLSAPFPPSSELNEAPICEPSDSQSQLDAAPTFHGSVCRVVARADGLDFSLDLTAHPATVLWNQECASFILDWSASVMSVSRFISQLQNATTPGAHRAQIALLYPTSFSLSLDISAPKLWIPVSRELKAGALLLDAGRLTMNVSKPKQSVQTDIDVDIGNINIMLAQEIYGLDGRSDKNDLTFLIRAQKKFVNIVQPFEIHINGRSGHSGDIEDTVEDHLPLLDGISAGKVSVTVGAIYLNLIDVEKLAKALGRLFASGVSRMRQITESGVLAKANLYSSKSNTDAASTSQSHATDLRIFVESVEMLLESYSATESLPLDRGNTRNRSYLVGIRGIRIQKRSMGTKSFSRFSISDASVQLAEAEQGTRRLKSGAEQIFAPIFPVSELDDGFVSTSHEAPCTPNRNKERPDSYKTSLRTPFSLSFFPVTPTLEPTDSAFVSSALIQGCHFHDGENYGDEIEVDVMPAIMKITPTSIQDCAGAVKRIFECGVLISREMERRVHTGGRIARASSTNRTGDVNISRDSSLLFRVTMKDATILVGRPASDFTFHRNSTRSDYVIQILTKASFIGQSIENEDGSGSRTQHLSVSDFAASINKSFDRVELTSKSPMLVAPTSADVRVVHKTVREGCATSQDFSFDIESMRISVVPHDIQVITSVIRKVLEKLNLVSRRDIGKKLSPFVHAKKKGSGIATSVRAELHAFSFEIMRSFKPKHDVRPFLNIYANQMKVNVEGCAAFLVDLSLQLGVKFFNPCALEWEDLMDSNEFLVTIEMMPSEIMVSVSSRDVICTNCSAIMIREIARIEQVKNISLDDIEQNNGGKRFYFTNETGLEVRLSHNGGEMVHSETIDSVAVSPGETCSIDSSFRRYTLTLASDDIDHSCCSLSMAKLSSKSSQSMFRMGSCESFDLEPVVEFVMENQRLTPDFGDVYDIEKGQDLLDSRVWSPVLVMNERRWLPPYHLEDDVPDWSDTTCTNQRTKDSVELPDSSWIWINDWEVDIEATTDADGWEYAAAFGAFDQTRRRYRRGDSCRRRRWTRTRAARKPNPPRMLTNFYMVLETSTESGRTILKARSRFRVVNETSLSLSIWGLPHSQDEQFLLGSIAPAQTLCVPLLQSAISFLRLASSTSYLSEDEISESIMIIPTGFSSNRTIRTSFRCDLSLKTYHFLLHLQSERGVVDIIIRPVLTLINLLPCQLQVQLGELRRGNVIEGTEEITVDTGIDTHCSVDCERRPHLSIKVPGYQWSRWSMIINRESNTDTWLPTEKSQRTLYETSGDDQYANEMKTVLQLEHICDGGAQLQLIMSVGPGPVPVIRFYAQYWIIDKTALGLNFTCGTKAATQLEPECLRKTYLSRNLQKDIPESEMKADGHEWSLGMSGMTLFFSSEKTISFAVGGDDSSSNWSSPIDVDKPMPESVKTAISVEDFIDSKRFELAYNVTRCRSLFSRTSIIAFYPRYQVVNLIGEDIYVAQEGALGFNTHISKQSCVHISGLDSQLPSKIRFSVAPVLDLWTLGGIELDKIGITSIRIPTVTEETLVVQCEVRLASKKQDSAVVVVIWASNKEQNPLYLLKNTSQKTVFCSQLLSQNTDDQVSQQNQSLSFVDNFLQCGSGCDSRAYDDDLHNGFVWTLGPGESKVFGFCNPEKSHILQWSVNQSDILLQRANDAEIDMVGFSNSCVMSNGRELSCSVQADRSTKVVLFSCDDGVVSYDDFAAGIEDFVALSLKVDLPGISVSVIDNASQVASAREIFLVNIEDWKLTIAQSREGFHELEAKLARLQVDNFIFDTNHRVLLSSKLNEEEFLHMTLVRRLQDDEATMVLSYAAFKLLDLDISLDRKTAETISRFLHPLHRSREDNINEEWIAVLTSKLSARYSRVRVKASHEIEKMAYTANTGRIYLEHLHIHPIRFFLTFTQQEVEDVDPDAEEFIAIQFIREMASITSAPIIFTSFIVSNAFESSQSLVGIIGTHYSSQLSNQMFSILGSLTILKVPADFLSNVGSGVKDFFYEPIQGLVHGPEEFLTGLEAGTFSLARGVVVAFVRGAADVTYLLSDNLATLTSDETFIGERNLYQKQLMYTNSAQRTVHDTLAIAGTTVVRGFQSAASGIIAQPRVHFSRQGASGLVIGAGLGIFGALVKPVVGLGDAAVVVMNHGLEATTATTLKGNKRLRRALPNAPSESENKTKLVCYDDMSAKIQQQVTKGETVDDVYLGHILTNHHLIIASEKYLWIIEKESVEPRCINWGEISYFEAGRSCMKIDVFSTQGTKSHILRMRQNEFSSLRELLTLKLDQSSLVGTSFTDLQGIKVNQSGHVFGSLNIPKELEEFDDEESIIQSCHDRINILGSFLPHYFHDLDKEAWLLINSLTQLFSGWSSRRCVVVGLINATHESIQIKSINMVEGGSPCHVIPTIEYDPINAVLHPGGILLCVGWGAVPSSMQTGRVMISIETNSFACSLADSISHTSSVEVLAGYKVGFLEKSIDESGWWAKYWMLLQADSSNEEIHF